MKDERPARLAARVRAVNRCYKIANERYPVLLAHFRQFVGQKIETNEGNLTAKVGKKLPTFKDEKIGDGFFRYRSNYSLAWTVKTCEQVEDTSGCVYYETTFYVGKMDNGVLTALEEGRTDSPTDYKVETVVAARKAYRIAKEAADEAQGKLHPFGEYDN